MMRQEFEPGDSGVLTTNSRPDHVEAKNISPPYMAALPDELQNARNRRIPRRGGPMGPPSCKQRASIQLPRWQAANKFSMKERSSVNRGGKRC